MRIHIMTSRISRGSHELTYYHQPALSLTFFMLGAHFCSKSSKVKAPSKLFPEAPLPSLFSSFKKVSHPSHPPRIGSARFFSLSHTRYNTLAVHTHSFWVLALCSLSSIILLLLAHLFSLTRIKAVRVYLGACRRDTPLQHGGPLLSDKLLLAPPVTQ